MARKRTKKLPAGHDEATAAYSRILEHLNGLGLADLDEHVAAFGPALDAEGLTPPAQALVRRWFSEAVARSRG